MAVNPIMSSGSAAVDAYSAGVNGIRAGVRGMGHAAQEIAEMNVRDGQGMPPPEQLESSVDALLDLKTYQRNVQASARVVETADAVVGFLLDIRA